MLHNSSKLTDVQDLLEKHKRKERELLLDLCLSHCHDDPEGVLNRLIAEVENSKVNTEDLHWTLNESTLVEQFLVQRHPREYSRRVGEPFTLDVQGSCLPAYWYNDKYAPGKAHVHNRVAPWFREALPELHGMPILDSDAALTLSFSM